MVNEGEGWVRVRVDGLKEGLRGWKEIEKCKEWRWRGGVGACLCMFRFRLRSGINSVHWMTIVYVGGGPAASHLSIAPFPRSYFFVSLSSLLLKMSLDAKINRAMARGTPVPGAVRSPESTGGVSVNPHQTPVPKSKESAKSTEEMSRSVAVASTEKKSRPTGRVVTFKVAQAKGLKRQNEFKVYLMLLVLLLWVQGRKEREEVGWGGTCTLLYILYPIFPSPLAMSFLD